ncbi:Uncharacterised protein [Mycobacteroides abscessus subsp. abscessus]|nr:Uncharacterised protein [Mycobacteroides abscessus subsp. abscessus]
MQARNNPRVMQRHQMHCLGTAHQEPASQRRQSRQRPRVVFSALLIQLPVVNPPELRCPASVLPVQPRRDGADNERHDHVGGDPARPREASQKQPAQQVSGGFNDQLGDSVRCRIVATDHHRHVLGRTPRQVRGLDRSPFVIADHKPRLFSHRRQPAGAVVLVWCQCLVAAHDVQRVLDKPAAVHHHRPDKAVQDRALKERALKGGRIRVVHDLEHQRAVLDVAARNTDQPVRRLAVIGQDAPVREGELRVIKRICDDRIHRIHSRGQESPQR